MLEKSPFSPNKSLTFSWCWGLVASLQALGSLKGSAKQALSGPREAKLINSMY